MWNIFSKEEKSDPLTPLQIHLNSPQLQQLVTHDNDLQNQLKFQDIIIEERAREIEIIVGQMQENHDMICAIHDMVISQGEVVDTIRDNIETTETNMEKGNKHLKEAEENQKKGNKLAMIVLAITAVVVSGMTTIIALVV